MAFLIEKDIISNDVIRKTLLIHVSNMILDICVILIKVIQSILYEIYIQPNSEN